ncbi:aminopeptidase N [Rhodopirellula maiorica SM1]|uniref:Aminopeptidase N n=1 Tax=Rhodopirellula maiorica SM1 TaxID=1265738 RepID=M5RB78_9BACT|nr:aminopeptidase N [Rhodopirellula maiorica]EMI16640.1 aminopeptidase N [Rhodopirellula maiorica SM1]
MTATQSIQPVLRSDYRPPTYWIENVELEFDLDPRETLVTARIAVRRNSQQPSDTLDLAGENLKLQSVAIDGKRLDGDQYQLRDDGMTLLNLPESCQIETKVLVSPLTNKSLSGLYQTSGNYCTQCEAVGFRRITYFLDRPDVMTTYRVTIRGDKKTCPVMLSNGNRIAAKDLDDGRHEVVWEDPFPKPSYLFALVAGNLKCHRGTFTTRSGRDVALEIWVEPQNIDKCEHALVSLQKSMKWDEDVFGLEYDLDIYMIVAVNDFNMGAMENKGLNVFNSKYVLALPDTATDEDYMLIEAVIAHEYFHNWTGNRVTCRDWFQLTLKEGLTVFRDQQFTADQTSAAVKRIDDVSGLRAGQFVEDSGPMAHPIRPESYISMDNFYTATVYRKGAEIIRMYHTILGAEGFRRGMDLYFQRHDNSAVTCDDFRAAMADANNINFDRFDRWYSQAGTPELTVTESWDAAKSEYALTMTQSYPTLPGGNPGTEDRNPVPLPVRVGLLDAESGEEIEQHSGVVMLDTETETFTFSGLSAKPIASVLRGFSAPVRLRMQRDNEELAFLMANDNDPFNRWDAGQTLATKLLIDAANGLADGRALELSEQFRDAFGRVLSDNSFDEAFKALALTLPRESVLGQEMDVIDPDSLHTARQFYRRRLAECFQSELTSLYNELAADGAYKNDQKSINRRRLKNVVLAYLSVLDVPACISRVSNQFHQADNMTDKQAALSLLANLDVPERDAALAAFYDQYKTDPLVIDKWYAVQALSSRPDTIEHVKQLTSHPDFSVDNPNRVRSLIGAFTQNQVRFHQADGAGYKLLADYVLEIESANPQLAARLVAAFNSYRRFDESRQTQMQDELKRIAEHPGLCKDVHEIVQRALHF